MLIFFIINQCAQPNEAIVNERWLENTIIVDKYSVYQSMPCVHFSSILLRDEYQYLTEKYDDPNISKLNYKNMNFSKKQLEICKFKYDEYIYVILSPIDIYYGFEVQKIKIDLFCNSNELSYHSFQYKDAESDRKLLQILLSSRYKNLIFIYNSSGSNCFRACNIETNEIVTIKITHQKENQNLLSNEELLIYLNLKHKNLAKFYEAYQYMNIILCVTEFVPFSLYNCPYSLINIQKIILQLIDFVEFLHARGIEHGDIIRKNILIDLESNIKIINFDNSKINQETKILLSCGLSNILIEKLNKTLYNSRLDYMEVNKIAIIIKKLYSNQYRMKMLANPNFKLKIYNEFAEFNDLFQEIENETLAQIIYNSIGYIRDFCHQYSLFELEEKMIKFFEIHENKFFN